MRRKPWAIVILALIHFFAPIGNIFFNALVTGRDIATYFSTAMTWQYLSYNWVILLAPIVAGYAIYACKKWSFYLYFVAITGLFVSSYIGFLSKADTMVGNTIPL